MCIRDSGQERLPVGPPRSTRLAELHLPALTPAPRNTHSTRSNTTRPPVTRVVASSAPLPLGHQRDTAAEAPMGNGKRLKQQRAAERAVVRPREVVHRAY